MAIGDVTDYSGGEVKAIELLASRTTTNGVPSEADAGLDVSLISRLFGSMPDVVELLLYSTAGSGTMSVTARLWGYTPASSGKWIPLGSGPDTLKGVINEGQAIGETSDDSIVHCEPVRGLGRFERVYLEITAISGTSTAVTGKLAVRRGTGA